MHCHCLKEVQPCRRLLLFLERICGMTNIRLLWSTEPPKGSPTRGWHLINYPMFSLTLWLTNIAAPTVPYYPLVECLLVDSTLRCFTLHLLSSETKQQAPSSESNRNFSNYCHNYNHACTAEMPLWAPVAPLLAGWPHRERMLINISASSTYWWLGHTKRASSLLSRVDVIRSSVYPYFFPRGKGKVQSSAK